MAFSEREDVSFSAQISRVLAQQPGVAPGLSVAEFAALGMPTDEAVVMIPKALSLGVDLVVYAVTPRVICKVLRPSDAFNYVLDSDVAEQLGTKFLLQTYSPSTLATSAIHSHWALLRFSTRNQCAAGQLDVSPRRIEAALGDARELCRQKATAAPGSAILAAPELWLG
jgi:hypothetical protein